MRNPKWDRDEIILALDLYFKLEPGQIGSKNPEIIELSEILNRLPIHKYRADEKKFRNSNGVGLKLSNFLAIDPNYHGKGMQSYSKLDKEIFDEFVNNRKELSSIASALRKTIQNHELTEKPYNTEYEDDNFTVKEGKVIYKRHRYIERNPTINQKKKNQYLKKYGKLKCEVCGFDFYEKYGELGKGFIECHHRKPLHEIKEEITTTLDDLALVCANCHRILHRNFEISIDKLKEIIKNGS